MTREVINSAKYVNQWEAYENLANAIIISAAADYKTALLLQKKHPGNKGVEADIAQLEKFFNSEWYTLLTNLDPGYLLRRIRETVEEEM